MTDSDHPLSEEYFDTVDPLILTRLVAGDTLSPGDLTYAAESFGRRLFSDVAVPVLVALLKSDSPLVREGAAYGLSHHMDYPGAKTALLVALQEEESCGVQQAIEEILADV